MQEHRNLFYVKKHALLKLRSGLAEQELTLEHYKTTIFDYADQELQEFSLKMKEKRIKKFEIEIEMTKLDIEKLEKEIMKMSCVDLIGHEDE